MPSRNANKSLKEAVRELKKRKRKRRNLRFTNPNGTAQVTLDASKREK